MNLKKLNDYSYIVEKEKDMNVPVKIFASKKLMDKMQQDRCLEQGINVAHLPGIQGFSIMMPDAHQGYGFSIGGVAAMDEHKGCISPGGIGFDINCLVEGSKILTNDGYYKNIKEFQSDFEQINSGNQEYDLALLVNKNKLVTLDEQSKSIQHIAPTFFMSKKHSGNVFKIRTSAGFEVTSTGDHPLLTENGMVDAGKLKLGYKLAVHPFEGVKFEKSESDEMLINEMRFSKQRYEELKKRNLHNLNYNHPKIAIIAKLFGYLLGDGTIYFSGDKGFVNAYGSYEDLESIKKDIEELGFSANIYSRYRNHDIPTKYDDVKFGTISHELHVSSNSLAQMFVELGYPLGNKTITSYLVPEWLMKSPKWIKRLFLSGLFGAELGKPKTISKTCFGCQTLSMNKNLEKVENAREFLIQIISLLEEFGIETYKLNQRKDYFNKHGSTVRFKLHIAGNDDNLLRLWQKIGFSYNKVREFISFVSIMYVKEKQRLNKIRVETAKKVKNLKKKGLTLKEVQKFLSGRVNDRFIERHYYENAGQRIPLNFISFKDYMKEKIEEHNKYGCLLDSIESINLEKYDGLVYDFNVPENHNFVSDNIIVSNCGVRLLVTNLTKKDVQPKIKELLDVLFKNIPPGIGQKSLFRLTDDELKNVLTRGPVWAVEQGLGTKEDLDNCESNGFLEGANPEKISQKAKSRGRAQLGTLGSGNHFLEIQFVDKIFDKETAKTFGIKNQNQCVVLIHTGSRGLGHQVCSDYLRKMEDFYPDIVASLPEKDLIYAPAQSEMAQDYFGAMKATANFAWTNRHIIGHQTRKSFQEIFGDKVELKTVYDVAHNIAKLEKHEIDGKEKKVYVHRKGATRAFPPGNKELPSKYQKTGQPIFIPGSMGTSSYVLAGTEKAMKESFGSTAHGAGRLMSRHAANNEWKGESLKIQLEKQNIYVKAASMRGISEEAPLAYKDVDEVVKISDKAGIGKLVAQLKPMGVIKG